MTVLIRWLGPHGLCFAGQHGQHYRGSPPPSPPTPPSSFPVGDLVIGLSPHILFPPPFAPPFPACHPSRCLTASRPFQEFLFKALIKTCLVESRATCCYSRCARTDKGVSALANVVSLRVRSKLPSGLGVVPPGASTELSERCKDRGYWMSRKMDDLDHPGCTRDDLENELPYIQALISSLSRPRSVRHERLVPQLLHAYGCIGAQTDMRSEGGSGNFFLSCSMGADACLAMQILNSCLPATIRVISWCPVVEDFNARFACNSRRYHYFFTRGSLDIAQMQVCHPSRDMHHWERHAQFVCPAAASPAV